tara:strand:- start:811 stop:1764 length:954 start_codon:yes stop_codon:yes gene_type:complete
MIEQEVTPDIQGTPESEAVEGGNPLEGFFRANGVEQQEQSNDPFAMDMNEGQPDSPLEEQKPEAPQETQDNDEKRYQYWQSEADKARNENAQMAQRLQALEQQVNSQPQPTVDDREDDRSFPPPPPKPDRPRNFSRSEALEDPTSDSAKYMDEIDDWRDEMDDYNRLQSEYNLAIVEEEKQKIQDERNNIMRQQAEQQQRQQQMANIHTHLKNTYQASDEEISQFVEIMDKPESVTLDNLFKLYRLQTGNQTAPVQNVQAPLTETSKNDSFEQMKRAQQVPTSMGVIPSQGNQTGTSEDSMMDSMISEYNKTNPWNG